MFFGFWIEQVIGQVTGVDVEFDGLEIRHASRDDSGSVSSATGSHFQLLLQLNQVSGRRYKYWRRPTFYARNCLLIASGLNTGSSVSMSSVLLGSKYFGLRPLSGRFLRRATFWSSLWLYLKFAWFLGWRASCVSVLLGNRPPTLFVAQLFSVGYFGLLRFSPLAWNLTLVTLLYTCRTGH
jgi:hypothetical protein